MIHHFKILLVPFLLLVTAIIVSSACSTDNDECTSAGQIVDYDSRECLCCPGWIIKTGGDSIKVSTSSVEAHISDIWDIVQTNGYPIPIKFDYKNGTGTCAIQYKEITCIKLDN